MMRFCIALLLVFTITKSQFAQNRLPGDAQLPILRRHDYPTYYTLIYPPIQTYYAYQPRYQSSYSYSYIICSSDAECPFGYGCYRNWFYRSNVCWPFHQNVMTGATRTSKVTERTSITTEIVNTEYEQDTTTDETRESTTTMSTTTDETSTIPATEAPEAA